MSARVTICCGSGGVGKTTLSAALAIRLALAGRRVAVLTIDPARRLADSLSIGAFGNEPRAVPLERLGDAKGGSLDAMMLDAKATFDGLIRRFAPDEATAQRVLRNRYYQFASSRLGGAHEYMAMEKLLELWQSDAYDEVVVDTPPTRHALDFLQAPDRLSHLLDQGVLRWLVMPATKGGWRAIELGSEAVARVLKRLLGRGTVGEIAEFFESFRDMWEDFRTRSDRVHALLRDPATRFLLIAAPDEAARTEALFFLDVLGDRGLPFGGFVVNRVLPAPAHDLDRDRLPEAGPLPPERWRAVLDGVVAAHDRRRRAAELHARAIAELRAAGPPDAPCWIVPDQGRDLHAFEDLALLLPHLPGAD